MEENSNKEEAVEILKEMGLKEYEAKCFVALTRLPEGTAKRISEVSGVPRTRVYDAVRVLETRGLVEVQHRSPQVFRAIPVDEALSILQERFDSRTERLGEKLKRAERSSVEGEKGVKHEVWALSGRQTVAGRARQLVEDSEEEVAIVARADALDEKIASSLGSALDRGVDVIVGTIDEEARELIQDRVPEAEVFGTDLKWLSSSDMYPGDKTEINRIMLVDGESILVSSFCLQEDGDMSDEQAVFGEGFNNGIVAIVRRLVSTGLKTHD
jgi:sugar-specific transcriptional regulator TrmB